MLDALAKLGALVAGQVYGHAALQQALGGGASGAKDGGLWAAVPVALETAGAVGGASPSKTQTRGCEHALSDP